LRRVEALVFVDNDATAEALVERGFAPQNVVVTENAYDPIESLPPRTPSSEPRLVTVGRLSLEKGIWDVVAIARRMPEVRVIVIGDGPLLGAVKARVRALGLDNVDIRGFVLEREKWQLLRTANAFVGPSREEGWGIAVGEAVTAGLPAVVYDLPAYQHFGDRVSRVPVGDVDALIAAVREALAHPSEPDAAGLPNWHDVLQRERALIESRFHEATA
jgi:glycosyltransferase involved in cell wall biosynthesis